MKTSEVSYVYTRNTRATRCLGNDTQFQISNCRGIFNVHKAHTTVWALSLWPMSVGEVLFFWGGGGVRSTNLWSGVRE